jgi:fibronectin-binding autotransporter adhesin
VQGTNGFNSITAPTLDVGLEWDYSALFSAGTISVIVVPEPSRALLLMLGLLGICVRRRRK